MCSMKVSKLYLSKLFLKNITGEVSREAHLTLFILFSHAFLGRSSYNILSCMHLGLFVSIQFHLFQN